MSLSTWLTLVVPDMDLSLAQASAEPPSLQESSLARLAGRGSLKLRWDRRDTQTQLCPWQRGLADALGIDLSLASAPISAVGGGLCDDANDAGYWMHAEAVHFAAGLDRLTFVELRQQARMAEAEYAALTETLASYFPANEFTLHAAQGGWFIRSARALQAVTSSPQAAATNDLQAMMPRGADAPGLRRLMTELQMLLHEHPVNEARARRGLPAINALWLWGAGTASPMSHERRLPLAFGDHAFLRGIYQLHGQRVTALPENGDTLVAAANKAQRVVAVVPAAELRSLESQWIAPLVQALAARRIDRLDLVLDEWHLDSDRAALRRFWRRPLSPAQWGQPS